MSKSIQKGSPSSGIIVPGKQRNYNEVVEYFDTHWKTNPHDPSLSAIKHLDSLFGSLFQKIPSILVTGTNGKSLTTHFITKLLREEKVSLGAFYSPHILTYNERFSINGETISNKIFTDLANEVITATETAQISANTYDMLLTMAYLLFKQHAVEVVLIENPDSEHINASHICTPSIIAVTRVTSVGENASHEVLQSVLNVVKPGSHVVSADQSKLNLQTMQGIVEQMGGIWTMPIRKLAPLSYPFEQLHGRCAALAERVSQIYVNAICHKDTILVTSNSLLVKQKGQRGRPTLESKRQLELNPRKTIEQFWKDCESTLPARFQVFDKEKPIILLDNASNLDAFKNLLLGVRLLNYHRTLKGLALIIASNNPYLNIPEFLKLLRYFFKKTSGQVIICPAPAHAGFNQHASWDVEEITNNIKNMKIKATASKNFVDAFELAQKMVDERDGLVVITGSTGLISAYWHNKGIKKI